MTGWRMDTDSLPACERPDAWQGAMQRLRLDHRASAVTDPVFGSLSWTESRRGTEFACVIAGPQTIFGCDPDAKRGFWIGSIIEGEAMLVAGRRQEPLTQGAMFYGRTGVPAALRFSTSFKLLVITVPREIIDPRLVSPVDQSVAQIPSLSPLGRIFNSLLCSSADLIDDLESEELKAVELAVTELFLAGLTGERSVSPRATTPSGHLRRIFHAIDSRLDDPDLGLAAVAQELALSERYIQKILATYGESFGRYILRRRLERCRADLSDIYLRHQSISEIAFRWGFNEAAYFSRSFRKQFGLSPRQYRIDRLGGLTQQSLPESARRLTPAMVRA